MTNIALLSAAHTHTKGFLKAIQEKDDVSTVAIWDDTEDRGRRYAEDFESDYSNDLAAVLSRENVDGFIICSENTRHLPLLEAAIPVGKPIFCEKPLVTKAEDARKALDLVRSHGTILHMGYFQPFAAELQGVLSLLETGLLGKLTHARYRNAHHAAYGRWFDSPDLAWFADPELAGGGAFMDTRRSPFTHPSGLRCPGVCGHIECIGHLHRNGRQRGRAPALRWESSEQWKRLGCRREVSEV